MLQKLEESFESIVFVKMSSSSSIFNGDDGDLSRVNAIDIQHMLYIQVITFQIMGLQDNSEKVMITLPSHSEIGISLQKYKYYIGAIDTNYRKRKYLEKIFHF